jgi:hypothetical protein
MYQFTTTTIINSNLDSNGSKAKYAGTSAKFEVSRVATLLSAGIVSVYKRPYIAPILAEAQVTVPTITAGLVARLDVDVRLSQQTDSEYANTYLYFKKPVVVEVIATGTAATDATALAAQINGLRDRYGFAYITATANGADIILTATNQNQRFFSAKVLKEDPDMLTNTLIEPVYTDVTAGTFAVNKVGQVGFGDDDWMQRKVMVQTLENTRYFGYNKEERPVLGGNYTQFTIRYKVEKDTEDGISNGVNYSITTHVFYVKSDLVADFEDQLDNVSGVTVTLVTGGGLINITGTTSLANSATSQLTAAGATGTVTWAVVSGTSATVSGTGLVTAHATTDGDTVISATDSIGASATVTITVA